MLQMNGSHLDKLPHNSSLNGARLNSFPPNDICFTPTDGGLLDVNFSITSQSQNPELFINNNAQQSFSSDEDLSPITPAFNTAFLPNQEQRFGMASYQNDANGLVSKPNVTSNGMMDRQSSLSNANPLASTTMTFTYTKQMYMNPQNRPPVNFYSQVSPQSYPLPTPPPEKSLALNRGNEGCISWNSQETPKSEYPCPPPVSSASDFFYPLQSPVNKTFPMEAQPFSVGYLGDRSNSSKASNGLLYPCIYPNCQKFFTSLSNLRLHSRIHSADRPFKCNICSKFFLRNHDLRRHEKIHLGLKPYPCSRCGRCFGRSDAMKRHMLMKRCAESNTRVKLEDIKE